MFKYFTIFVVFALAIYLLIGAFLYFRQSSLVFPADHRPIGDPVSFIPGARVVALHTLDGLTLGAYYLAPAAGAPVVLYLHGNAGSITNRLPRFALLAKDGVGLLALEYRGYANNPGRPSENGFRLDAAAAVSFLRHSGVESRQIVVHGESLGTNVALRTALDFPVAALILEAPFTSIADVAVSRYRYFPIRWLLRNRFDTLSHISDLKVPLLVMRTLRDETVSPSQSLMVFNAAPEPKQLWSTRQGSHSTLIENGGLAVLSRFIKRVCPQVSH